MGIKYFYIGMHVKINIDKAKKRLSEAKIPITKEEISEYLEGFRDKTLIVSWFPKTSGMVNLRCFRYSLKLDELILLKSIQ